MRRTTGRIGACAVLLALLATGAVAGWVVDEHGDCVLVLGRRYTRSRRSPTLISNGTSVRHFRDLASASEIRTTSRAACGFASRFTAARMRASRGPSSSRRSSL